MKICSRGLNRLQVTDCEGSIRVCAWLRDGGVIGKLSENTLEEIWHGDRANEIREQLAKGDYSNCKIDECPYLSMGTINDNLVEIDKIPEYPTELQLAFERICNYSCTCCNNEHFMQTCDWKKEEEGYRVVAEKLRSVLPHLKVIGANGLAELFCSKYILQLLSEWQPLAPKEDIHVILETNGSLFDAAHWGQIENLGQYNLLVAITVMSFQERTYQILSGTDLPLTNIVNNLRFVKSLREKGIINHLELATVVQERNFREMPEFAKRCIEEFGADTVRLRPYEPYGSRSPEVEWFTDIRGKYHPYHQEYREIMSHPIFKHPKVRDWSGGLDSERQELPQVIQLREANKRCNRYREKIKILEIMMTETEWVHSLNECVKDKGIVIYGLGAIGKKLIEAISDKSIVKCVLDKDAGKSVENIPVYQPDQAPDEMKALDVIVTPVFGTDTIMTYLTEYGYRGKIIDIREIVGIKAQCV